MLIEISKQYKVYYDKCEKICIHPIYFMMTIYNNEITNYYILANVSISPISISWEIRKELLTTDLIKALKEASK